MFRVHPKNPYVSILENLSINNKKSLLFISENNNNLFLSSKNVKKSSVKNIDQISTYDIIESDKLILTVDSIKKLESILLN